MNKKYIIPLLSLFVLASCSSGSNTTLSRIGTTEPTTIVEPEATIATTKTEKPVLVSDIKEDEYNKILTYYFKKLKSFKSYKAVTSGKTTAQVLFISTDQSIDVTLIKGEYSYMINESHSSFVNTSHEVYYYGNKALFRDNGTEEFSLLELAPYLDIYGVYPFDDAVEGYIVDNGGLLEITKVESETDYKFKLSFSPDVSTTNVRIQMKKFGGLDDYPVFKDITLYLTLKNDFTPVSIDLVSNYTAQKIMGSDCHQEYKVTFSNFDEEIEVPKLEEIMNKFN